MTHYRLSCRTKDHAAESGAAMGRNYNQIYFAVGGHPDDLSRRIAMGNYLFYFEAVQLFAVNYLRQFTLGRIFKLFTDVGNRHGIGQPRVSYGWDHWLEHINANYFRFDSPRNRGGVGHRIVRAPAEISRQQDRAELQRRGGSFRSFAFHVQREGILHA